MRRAAPTGAPPARVLAIKAQHAAAAPKPGGLPKWSPVHAQVQQSVRERCLIPNGSSVLIAVSGGQDSLCAARVLMDIAYSSRQWTIGIAHCDHRWRPDSAANAMHVRRLAEDEWGRQFHLAVAHEPLAGEGAARGWRYNRLMQMAVDHGYSLVVTGHTASDRAETLLFNLMRGSGADGLQALAWRRPLAAGVELVRPLLDLSRVQTGAFCVDFHLPVWEDSTNADVRYRRNAVRHELLPLMRRRFNPRVDTALSRAAESLTADVAYLEQQAAALLQRALAGSPNSHDGRGDDDNRPAAGGVKQGLGVAGGGTTAATQETAVLLPTASVGLHGDDGRDGGGLVGGSRGPGVAGGGTMATTHEEEDMQAWGDTLQGEVGVPQAGEDTLCLSGRHQDEGGVMDLVTPPDHVARVVAGSSAAGGSTAGPAPPSVSQTFIPEDGCAPPPVSQTSVAEDGSAPPSVSQTFVPEDGGELPVRDGCRIPPPRIAASGAAYDCLDRGILRSAPLALQRRAVRQLLACRLPKAANFDCVENVLALLDAPQRSRVGNLPGVGAAEVQGTCIVVEYGRPAREGNAP